MPSIATQTVPVTISTIDDAFITEDPILEEGENCNPVCQLHALHCGEDLLHPMGFSHKDDFLDNVKLCELNDLLLTKSIALDRASPLAWSTYKEYLEQLDYVGSLAVHMKARFYIDKELGYKFKCCTDCIDEDSLQYRNIEYYEKHFVRSDMRRVLNEFVDSQEYICRKCNKFIFEFQDIEGSKCHHCGLIYSSLESDWAEVPDEFVHLKQDYLEAMNFDSLITPKFVPVVPNEFPSTSADMKNE
jgi:hypothetical protein